MKCIAVFAAISLAKAEAMAKEKINEDAAEQQGVDAVHSFAERAAAANAKAAASMGMSSSHITTQEYQEIYDIICAAGSLGEPDGDKIANAIKDAIGDYGGLYTAICAGGKIGLNNAGYIGLAHLNRFAGKADKIAIKDAIGSSIFGDESVKTTTKTEREVVV